MHSFKKKKPSDRFRARQTAKEKPIGERVEDKVELDRSTPPRGNYPAFVYDSAIGGLVLRENVINNSLDDIHPVGKAAKEYVELPTGNEQKILPATPSVNMFSNKFPTEDHDESYGVSGRDSMSSQNGEFQLLRMQNMLLEAGYKHPELRGVTGESAEDSVLRLLNQYKSLREAQQGSSTVSNANQKETKIRQLEYELAYEMDSNKARQEHENTQRQNLEQMVKDVELRRTREATEYKEEIKTLTAQVKKLTDENRSPILNHDEVKRQVIHMEKLNDHILQLDREKIKMKSTHEKAQNRLRDAHSDEMEDLRNRMDEQMTNARQEFAMKEAMLQRNHDEDLSRMNNDMRQRDAEMQSKIKKIEVVNNTRLENMRKEHEAELASQKTKVEEAWKDKVAKHMEKLRHIEMENVELRNIIQTIEQQLHQANKSQDERQIQEEQRLQAVLQTQEKSLRQQYEEEKMNLRAVIEDFKRGAVIKPQIKTLTDSEVNAKFSKLATAVEDFSRIQWDSAKESGWWQEQFQQLQARNTRRIKQQIVQNSLWISLYQHVFRSPFKFFDDDDAWKELDKDWIEIYASGESSLSWPKVSAESEAMRCDNAKSLRSMIQASGPRDSQQEMTDVQKRYENNIAVTVNTFAESISKVASLKNKDYKTLESIVRFATDIWLECCSQRYRLIMSLVTGIEDILGLSKGHIRMVKLVLKPGLRRFGDNRGSNFTEEETIKGWRSSFEVYPPQRGGSM